MRREYSIKQVRDIEGHHWNAEEILAKPANEINRIRTDCYQAHSLGTKPPYVCAYCHKAVWLPATIVREHHFKHFHYEGIQDCIYYSGASVTIERLNARKYNGVKEGRKHIEFKELILRCLALNPLISRLQREQVISLPKLESNDYRREWRKPDINGSFNEIHFALELQFSTTWLKEIVGRTVFYRKLGYYLLWVFDKFYPEYTDRELAYSDVFCNNNENAFVFDKECYQLSKERKDLVLKCHYNKYLRNGFEVVEEMVSEIIIFSDLKFDQKKRMVYYHDSLGEKATIEAEIEVEEESLEREAKRQLEEYQRIERNKEFDLEIASVSFSLENEEPKLIELGKEINETYALMELHAKYEEEFDTKMIAMEITSALQDGRAIPEMHNKILDDWIINLYIERINFAKSKILENERNKIYLQNVLATLKIVSQKKIKGEEYIVVPKDKSIFTEFYQSIYSLRRIEIETTLIKPNLQKITYSQIMPSILSNNETLFVMSKSVFERCRRELSARVSSINTSLDLTEICHDIERDLIKARKERRQNNTRHLGSLESKLKESSDLVETLKKKLRNAVERKERYNTVFVF